MLLASIEGGVSVLALVVGCFFFFAYLYMQELTITQKKHESAKKTNFKLTSVYQILKTSRKRLFRSHACSSIILLLFRPVHISFYYQPGEFNKLAVFLGSSSPAA